MTTLLSCKKTETVDYMFVVASELSVMKTQIMAMAEFIDLEKKALKESLSEEDYQAFLSRCEVTNEDIENTYGQAHSQVLKQLETFESGKSKTEVEEKIEQNTILFEELLNYHFMIVHARLQLYQFDYVVNDLTEYLSQGKITTVDYNDALSLLMEDYDTLLDLESLDIYELAPESSLDMIETTILKLKEVQIQLDLLPIATDIDATVNQAVKDMFLLVQNTMSIVYNGSTQGRKVVPVNVEIYNGALVYVEEVFKSLE